MPLLFLFYINNLAGNPSNDAVVGLFADDVSNLTTARRKEDTFAAAESELSKVYDWSQKWKRKLNADKKRMLSFFHLVQQQQKTPLTYYWRAANQS